jgi:hypothetical protein
MTNYDKNDRLKKSPTSKVQCDFAQSAHITCF